MEVVRAEVGEVFDVELEADILEANRELAEENRAFLRSHGITAIDILGAIGSGKTSLIEQLVKNLAGRYRMAAFKGDVTTTLDAERISRHGVPVVPITTGKECHLDANLIRKALAKIPVEAIDLLLIENVGNLICPAEFPLGSEKRAVVVSVTEGPHTIVKHPFIFIGADLVVINKVDLAENMGVDVNALREDVRTITPKTAVVATNCRTGDGLAQVIEALGL